MKIGDVVIPITNRFPATNQRGEPIDCADDFLDFPAIVTYIGPCVVKVRAVETGKEWFYRGDELSFYCTKKAWRAQTYELIAA